MLVTVYLPGSTERPRPDSATAALPLDARGRLTVSAGVRREAGRLQRSAATMWALPADTVDYGKWRTGVRSEGINYSTLSFSPPPPGRPLGLGGAARRGPRRRGQGPAGRKVRRKRIRQGRPSGP